MLKEGGKLQLQFNIPEKRNDEAMLKQSLVFLTSFKIDSTHSSTLLKGGGKPLQQCHSTKLNGCWSRLPGPLSVQVEKSFTAEVAKIFTWKEKIKS